MKKNVDSYLSHCQEPQNEHRYYEKFEYQLKGNHISHRLSFQLRRA